MDILQDSAEPSKEGLDDLVETNPVTTATPVGAVRNRAATSAILSGSGDQMVEKYRLLMQEGMEGSSVTHDQVQEALTLENRTKNMGHVINILADKSIPLEEKRRIMGVVQNNGFKQEPAMVLQTKALEEGSEGEDMRGEAARISLSDTMNEINQEAQDRQKIMNGLMASIPEQQAKSQFVGDLAAAEVLPLGRNVIAARVAAKVDELDGKTTTLGAWVKNFLTPGSTKKELQDKLMSIPPAKRNEYSMRLVSAIKESASVFPSDNYYAQYQTATKLLEAPLQKNEEAWMENMMTVLDGFWVGSEIRALGSLGRVARGAAGAEAGSRARRPGSANPGTEDVPFTEITPADWTLVDEPFNPFAPRIGETKPLLGNKASPKSLPGPKSVEDVQERLQLNSVVRRENPVTPYSIVEQANPASARAMHQTIVSGTDEVAEALTGVGREQAIINNVYPQITTESGTVLNKVNQDITDNILNAGATRYTPEEYAAAVDTVKNDFRNASGLQINDAMTTFREDGAYVHIDAHFGTSGGSFTTPEGARAQAKFALRGFGIRDDEIVVMKRQGMDYVPVTSADNSPGDYMVKVKTSHAIDDSEVARWNPLDVKRNWTDRISQTGSEDHGSLAGWLMDPAAMLHPTLTGSASIAVDQSITLENIVLKPVKEFRTQVNSFPKARRDAIDSYIKEANTNGIKMDDFDLVARGFNADEVKALKQWKDIWDTNYYLENFDLVRSLNSQGFQVFDNGVDKLFGKPVSKNQNIGAVYDPNSQSVRHLSIQDMDSLYNSGGSYVKLRRPVSINGVDVEHMMVRNTPTEYIRKVRDTDSVLNYRDGYYTVNYAKGSKFVDEIKVDASGKETRRTVAVANNTADADMFAQSRQQSSGNRHEVREDSRGFAKDGDGYWDVNSASGRIAQRLRGKPLETASGINQLGTGVYTENPMESATRAARSVAGRTVSRPMLETAKKRFMEQYGEMLPSDGMGGKRYPNNRSEIVDHVSHVSKRVADARTTYGYIKFLEDGYINTADQIFKGGMNVLANRFGAAHMSLAERGAIKASNISPSQLAKSVVFNAYIVGSNPIRQWIVQSHQATRMMAYNPISFANGGFVQRMAGYLGKAGGIPGGSRVVDDFYRFVEDSGMVAGVDRNSLVRGLGLSMADASSDVKRAIGTVASLPQTLGFDVGEKINQLGHLAAVHEKWTRKGIDLTNKTNRDLALTEARALSYDLNKAGELTYTQGSAAAVLQFLQMPHKAILQLVNRKLPLMDRITLAAWDLIMFGAPITLIGGIVAAVGADDSEGILPDDPDKRDLYVYGVTSMAYNKMFQMFVDEAGEKTRIDFTALAPNDMDGWARMYHTMADQGPFAALAASPAGQILAVDGINGSRKNGRIPQALITMGRYFNVFEEFDPQNPTEFKAVLNDVAKISSGWTAAQNAKILLETRKKMDASGSVVDRGVTESEANAAFLGFGTLSTKELYQISKNRSADKKRHEEDVMRRYRDIKTYYTNALGVDAADLKHIQGVSSMLMRSFDDPGDMDLVLREWKKDMAGKDQALLGTMLKASGMPDSRKLADDIRMWDTDEKTKALLLQRMKDMQKLRDVQQQQKDGNG